MNIVINRERLAQTFIELCEISSPSRHEKTVADHLRELFNHLGAESIFEDTSMAATGADSGNLIIRFAGNDEGLPGAFFSCHMDTVQPGEGVKVSRRNDIFTSAGDTILGGDDKSGIAAIIETIRLLKENKARHGLIEVVLTTCEEIGLLGAKHLDYSQIQAKYGYALDSSGTDRVIIGAPAANKFKITVQGLAAHAGLNPENGINAILVAAKAIAGLRLGRLDEESTANFGLISGGMATNIIPDAVTIEGEVRSHSVEKLQRYTREIETAFQRTVETWPGRQTVDGAERPAVTIATLAEYPAMRLHRESALIRRIDAAGKAVGKELQFVIAGGGSDANIFNGYGLPTAIVATGMDKVHTIDEQLDLNHIVDLTRILYALATIPEPNA
jgi:tripeptide aminopeptidase